MSASSRPHSPKVCACGDAKSFDGRHRVRRRGVSPTRCDAFRYATSDPNVLGLPLLHRPQRHGHAATDCGVPFSGNWVSPNRAPYTLPLCSPGILDGVLKPSFVSSFFSNYADMTSRIIDHMSRILSMLTMCRVPEAFQCSLPMRFTMK